MIYIFSGDDIVSSRKAFLEHIERLKTDGFLVERVSGKDLTLESMEMLSSPTSLFGEKKAIAIENLMTLTKSKEKDKLINLAISLSRYLVFVIWENKGVSKTELAKFPQNTIFKNFKLPGSLFVFLDSFSPGNVVNNLVLLKTTLETVDPNFLFLMLIRQIRLLILAKDSSELLKLAPWQKSKLLKQAKVFSDEKLAKIYNSLLEIDFHQKTSSSPSSLEQELELLFSYI